MQSKPDRLSVLSLAAVTAILLLTAPAAAVALDLQVTDVEVTQVNQDLDNTVRLVGKKNTWVRVHAFVSGAEEVAGVVARLTFKRTAPGPVTLLGSIDSPPMVVVDNPVRTFKDHAFNLQVPYAWRSGTVEISAVVDDANEIAESNEQNNTRKVTVTFETVPPIRVRAFGVQFPGGSLPAQTHYDHIQSWLRRAYPTSALSFEQKTLTTQVNWGNATCSCLKDSDGNCLNNTKGSCLNGPARICDSNTDCGCGWLNEILMQRRALESKAPDFEPDTRYVALVDDGAGFMRGCSPGADEKVAAGPVGSDTWGWDNDGSYADWYTGHELGHAYGRPHAGCCGAPNGATYPYPMCQIGDDEQAGFDSGGPKVFSSHARDVMSYCSGIWMSDFTFEAILDQLIAEDGEPLPPLNLYNNLAIVSGNANLSLGRADLTAVHQLPPMRTRLAASSGDWELKFLDASGATIASHAFTPGEVEDDHDLVPPSIGADGAARHRIALFAETVELPVGPIARLGLYHLGIELDSRSVSANPPSVTILSPNGGTISRTPTIEWSAGDPDNDPLSFTLLYSSDAGDSWQMLATDLDESSLAVDLNGLPGGDSVLFRVVASDGFHNTSDDSNGWLSVANGLPQVVISDPEDGTAIATGQTAMLDGSALDPEDGELDGESLVWVSDRQGVLGTGSHVELGAELVPGTHLITLTATDTEGESAAASFRLIKGSSAADGCPAYPRTDCDAAETASLTLSDRGGRRKLAFRFGPATTNRDASAFGDPLSTTDHTLCLYEGGRLRDAILLPASPAQWAPSRDRGFRYVDRDGAGIHRASLRAGRLDRPAGARVSLRGSGTDLPSLAAPLQLPVTVQLNNDTTPVCFGAEPDATRIRRNEKGAFQAR